MWPESPEPRACRAVSVSCLPALLHRLAGLPAMVHRLAGLRYPASKRRDANRAQTTQNPSRDHPEAGFVLQRPNAKHQISNKDQFPNQKDPMYEGWELPFHQNVGPQDVERMS